MWNLAHSMGLIIGAAVMLSAAHVGLGLIVFKAFGAAPRRCEDVFYLFWTGWAVTIAGLTAWNLFLPCDGVSFGFFGLVGVVGLAFFGRTLLSLVRPEVRRVRSQCVAVCTVAIALFWVNQAIGVPMAYDSGLYHFSAIRWARSFAAVPGLGNLHDRLAFNQSSFLYVAMLGWGPWKGHAHGIQNALLLTWLFAQGAWSSVRLFERDGRGKEADFFRVLLTSGALAYTAVFPYIASPSPDAVAMLLGAVLMSALVELVFTQEQYLPAFLVLMACAGVLVKLTLAPLGLAAVACVFAAKFSKTGESRPLAAGLPGLPPDEKLESGNAANPGVSARRFLISAAVIAVLVCVPWLIRGVILSGYLFYPMTTVGAIPVPWRMSESAVQSQKDWILAAARSPGANPQEVLGNWNWLGPWWARMCRPSEGMLVLGPLAVFLLACAAALAARLARDRRSRPRATAWLIIGPPLLAAVFWFFRGPDCRFAGLAFWMLAAGGIILFMREFTRERVPRYIPAAVCAAVAAATLAGLYASTDLANLRPWPSGPEGGFYPVPTAQLRVYLTSSGLKVYVPESGVADNYGGLASDKCWDAPLPCTPYPDPRLRLREEGNLESGFLLVQGDTRREEKH